MHVNFHPGPLLHYVHSVFQEMKGNFVNDDHKKLLVLLVAVLSVLHENNVGLFVVQFKPAVLCTTRQDFRKNGSVYEITGLLPGNYSVHVKANSLAGDGDYTPKAYFLITASTLSTVFTHFLPLEVCITVMLSLYSIYFSSISQF